MTNRKNISKSEISSNKNTKIKCGIIMPISSIAGCTVDHWNDIKKIINEVTESLNYESEIVSVSKESTIIQKNIIQNLYSNDIVICDVSCKNPNVMFELGMRLAFDKPTIIIKDNETDYSFDTSPLQHLEYPRDLRYNKINKFKKDLKEKLESTYLASKEKTGYSTFLKNFGEFTVQKLENKEVSKDEYIIESIKEMKNEIVKLHELTVQKYDYYVPRSDINIKSEEKMFISKLKRFIVNNGLLDLSQEKLRDISIKYLINNCNLENINHSINIDEYINMAIRDLRSSNSQKITKTYGSIK